MKKISRKTRIIFLIDLIIFFVCIIGIYHVVEKAGLEPTRHVIFEQDENSVKIKKVIDPDLKKKILPGDIIVSINRHSVSKKEDIEFILDACAIDDVVSIRLLRNNQSLTEYIRLSAYYTWFYVVSQLIVGFAFFALGVFVIYKRPSLLAAKVWHWSSIGAAIIITCTWGRYSISPVGLGHLIRIFFIAAYAFVPPLFFQLSFVFPRNKFARLNKVLIPLFALSFVLSVWSVVSFLYATANFSMEWFHDFMIAFDINRLYFACSILFGMANIIHSYIKAKEESERRKIRWVLLGLAVGPPSFVILWQIPQLLSYNSFIPEYIIVLLVAVVPVTFSISIVKYNILDIDLIVRRSTIYFIVVTFLIIVYAMIIGLVVLFIGSFTVEASLIASVTLAILIPILFEPVRQVAQKWVDRKFFHVRYNYRLAQNSFLKELNECFNIESITKMLLGKLDILLKPEFIQIHLKEKKGYKWHLYTGQKSLPVKHDILNSFSAISAGIDVKIYSRKNCIETEIGYEDISGLRFMDRVSLIIPIQTQLKENMGFLVCGSKKSGDRYSMEDIDLLSTICIQTGIRIEKILLQEELIIKRGEAEKLEEINKAKSFFVSSISHDLQTPLTSIKMFTELLQEKKDLAFENRQEYLAIIENESERLSRLIKNVLDLSQIERGVKKYNFRTVDLNSIIGKVVKLMGYSLKQNGFKFKVNLTEKEVPFLADEDALISCIVNIISNAMKYSLVKKEIEISTCANQDKVILVISDKGMGIPKEEQSKIFDTFYRSENEQIQNVAGVGLGLTITSYVVKEHKGNINLKSEPDSGSTFTLSFPLQ